jgi:hypothetical protein
LTRLPGKAFNSKLLASNAKYHYRDKVAKATRNTTGSIQMLEADNVPGTKVFIGFTNNNVARNIDTIPIQKIKREFKNNKDYILPDILVGNRRMVDLLHHRGGIKALCKD